ncbi:uncharacterized protein LOC131217304 [Magnolia sinica]|uniref:uncharacterized protein LOC131217304 n=1 Tax=Magnolia sinica TaxID=86752 RepID=UPI0026590E67|nr:uncharacterized protein LOC131217304 [Magnolia sinica]
MIRDLTHLSGSKDEIVFAFYLFPAQTEDGGVIDCVDIYKQPAFGDPLLKNHTIQMRPSDYPEGKVGKASPRSVQQTWQKSGSCPEGTVPIRRTTKNDLMIRPVYPYISGKEYENGILEVAGASVNNRQYYGTTFDVGVWNIDVQSNEFSMAAVFIANNDNWITVGWKADGGHKTGCYNLLCWGFIQVDHTIVLGDFLSSVSTYDGADYYLPLTVYLDRTNNKWWLGIFDVKWVGYWPLHIFSNLNGASRIHWTGQVLNTESGGYHTFTKMGSGHFSSEGYRKAAYFANMYVMDDKNTYQQPYGAKSYASRPGILLKIVSVMEKAKLGKIMLFKVTILTKDGDIIDCVDIYNQPAFGDPLLKNHTIQMRPSDYPKGKVRKASPRPIQQTWQKSGSCPEGTVPIRRTTTSDFIRPMSPYINGKDNQNAIIEGAGASANNGPYYGSIFDVGVWNVEVQSNEFSMAAVFITNNDNWITVGWKIMQSQFGDNQTRLFTYWTADGGHKTGCYDLLCWGFIQVDHTIVLGDTLSPVSTYGGADYYVQLEVFLDHTNNEWWLGYDDKWLGYWPLNIFSNLNSASWIHWTGQVLNTASGGHHTFTQMGSGHFPSEGYRKAAYFRNMYVLDDKNTYQQPYGAKSYATRPGCYGIEDITYDDSDNGNHFFYGGPGVGITCP